MRFLPFFTLLFLLNSPEITAEKFQDPEPLKFDRERLEELKNDPAFDYSEAGQSDNWWTTFKRWVRLKWNQFLEWLFGEYEAPYLLEVFLDILPYLLLAILLGFIVYLFNKLYVARTKLENAKEASLLFDEEEQIVKHRDIQKLITKAEEKEDFRLAVRYQFLYVLRQLSENELIIYNSSKTDEDYISELPEGELQRQFRRLTRIYDFTWYGKFEPSAEEYEKFRREFQKTETSMQAAV